MRLQICRMVYEDVDGIGPADVVSLQDAGKILGMKLWSVGQLVDDGELTMLIDADAPKGWAWRFLLFAIRGGGAGGIQTVREETPVSCRQTH